MKGVETSLTYGKLMTIFWQHRGWFRLSIYDREISYMVVVNGCSGLFDLTIKPQENLQ